MPPLIKLFLCFLVSTALHAIVQSFQLPTARRGIASGRCPLSQPPRCRRVGRAREIPARPLRSSDDDGDRDSDPLISRATKTLGTSSFLSWWSQVVLTLISSVTFLFALNAAGARATAPAEFGRMAGKFFLPGLGIAASTMSIMWTWGQRRLARRLVWRASASRVEAANLLRRVVKVGVALNLVGLLASLLGAQYVVGTLAARSMLSFAGIGGGIAGGVFASQTLQPLDVLVVQANTNVLSSHFVSLACLVWLARMVDLLDPPSVEGDDARSMRVQAPQMINGEDNRASSVVRASDQVAEGRP